MEHAILHYLDSLSIPDNIFLAWNANEFCMWKKINEHQAHWTTIFDFFMQIYFMIKLIVSFKYWLKTQLLVKIDVRLCTSVYNLLCD